MVGSAFRVNGVLGLDTTIGGIVEYSVSPRNWSVDPYYADYSIYYISDLRQNGDYKYASEVHITNSDVINYPYGGLEGEYKLVRFVKK